MEELLNKLIEKGFQPFGKVPVNINQWNCTQTYCKYFGTGCIHIHREDDIEDEDLRRPRRTDEFSLRELVSKESGLWQFVCENRMTKKMEKIPRGIWINSWHKSAYEKCPVYTMEKAEYRLIESALCNEEDLEQFLLDNIKV